MKVILLQDIAKIGKKFDIKEVANGYALNFLFPKQQAKLATDKAVKEIQEEKKKYQEILKLKNEKLKEIINNIKESKIEISTNINEEGKLFAGIGVKTIAKAILDKTGETIDSEILELKNPIKEIGEHEIGIKIEDKIIKLTVEVKANK